MTYRGHVKNGVIVLDEPADLPEGADVHVELAEPQQKPEPEDKVPTLYERLKPVIGKAKHMPPDAAINHDHYLYGMPKRTP